MTTLAASRPQVSASMVACPPEHAERLTDAGVVTTCLDHACPLCTVDPAHQHCVIGQGNLPSVFQVAECVECLQTCPACLLDCGVCLDAWAVVEAFEAPPGDPWCLEHGLVSAQTVGGCYGCSHALTAARENGWAEIPNYYGGVGSAHCTVCGRGSWLGQVCSSCWRCESHPRSPVAAPPHLAEHPVWRWQAAETRTPTQACQTPYWDRFTCGLRLRHKSVFFDVETGRWAS